MGLCRSFSALQRAEIAEMQKRVTTYGRGFRFSALQRAEIAEIQASPPIPRASGRVSVLFNEPKLLKFKMSGRTSPAERFQCSSTSRNC